jgi:hypothetical protein
VSFTMRHLLVSLVLFVIPCLQSVASGERLPDAGGEGKRALDFSVDFGRVAVGNRVSRSFGIAVPNQTEAVDVTLSNCSSAFCAALS